MATRRTAGAVSSIPTSGRSGRRCTEAKSRDASTASPASSTSCRSRCGGLNVADATSGDAEVLEMGFDEVVLAANDPDHFERGFVRFTVLGGRQ